MKTPTAGYREVNHTADWELEVWAPDLPALLEQAARGMLALSGTELAPEPRISRELALHGGDAESLLVGFLAELLYIQEIEGAAFDEYRLALDGLEGRAELSGAPVTAVDKEIKAVTWHNLRVETTEAGLRVNIVFDV